MSKISIQSNLIMIATKSGDYSIPVHDVLYIESELRTINIYTIDDTYHCYERLDLIEKQLDRYGFIRCHQNYLVQAEYITCFDNHTLQLKDTDFTIPVSRRCHKEIRQLMLNDNENGILTCVEGFYAGYIVKLEPNQPFMIGRDGNVSDIIIQLPLVSRLHCKLVYHDYNGEYEVTDYSTNGTFIHDDIRLIPKQSYTLEPDSTICFGDRTNIFKVL